MVTVSLAHAKAHLSELLDKVVYSLDNTLVKAGALLGMPVSRGIGGG
jgi:hypothetical protein